MKKLIMVALLLGCGACCQKTIRCGIITDVAKTYDWQCETVSVDGIWDWKSCTGHIKGENICLCEDGKGNRKLYAQKCP